MNVPEKQDSIDSTTPHLEITSDILEMITQAANEIIKDERIDSRSASLAVWHLVNLKNDVRKKYGLEIREIVGNGIHH